MSKKLKLSQWHDGSVKPVHVGVYERDYGFDEPVYTFWDGKCWGYSGYTVKETLKVSLSETGHVSPYQNDEWRGIVK